MYGFQVKLDCNKADAGRSLLWSYHVAHNIALMMQDEACCGRIMLLTT
jgi:hypothetical protein